MIMGFEEQTGNLTDKELGVIQHIVDQLNKTSKEKPLKNRGINGNLSLAGRGWFNSARIRKMINYISINQLTRLPLVANNRGYYITNNQDEIDRYLLSLTQRIQSIIYRRGAVKTWRITSE
jgi:hypothetical protein